jgi:hypothetical protein
MGIIIIVKIDNYCAHGGATLYTGITSVRLK